MARNGYRALVVAGGAGVITTVIAAVAMSYFGADATLAWALTAALPLYLVFGGASALIALAYLGPAGLLGLAAGERQSLGVAVLVTLAAVVAFQPFRRRLEHWARRWVLGSSGTGTELLRQVGDTLADSHDSRQLGSRLVKTVVESLDLQWARLTLAPPAGRMPPRRPVTVHGAGGDQGEAPDLVIPLGQTGEAEGYLECGPKQDGELTKADEALLVSVARQASLAIRNIRLTAELEVRLGELSRQAEELAASRNRIVQAQMQERHRIERNIHDGVQQDIVALIAKVSLARNQLARSPRQAGATLADWHQDARRTLENLRALSRGIHSPALTHHGLVEALRTQAAALPIEVRLDIDPQLRGARFPDEVEETAYYVISEGLTNVLKHAGTSHATVALATVDGYLTVEVTDYGQGYDGDNGDGSGITGLRDRLAALGGRLETHTSVGDGTVLRAVLRAARADS